MSSQGLEKYKGMTAKESQMVERMISQQIKEGVIKFFMTAKNVPIEAGMWYTSKRGSLFKVKELHEDGWITGISHLTGTEVKIPPEQVYWINPADEPDTEPGMLLMGGSSDDTEKANGVAHKYAHLYNKYSHIKPGSIFRVKNIKGDDTPNWKKKKIQIKGQVRCVIVCECGNEREIKVQDAFQVKKCIECKKRKRRKSLDKFLEKKK
jgi:hypothetical protein